MAEGRWDCEAMKRAPWRSTLGTKAAHPGQRCRVTSGSCCPGNLDIVEAQIRRNQWVRRCLPVLPLSLCSKPPLQVATPQGWVCTNAWLPVQSNCRIWPKFICSLSFPFYWRTPSPHAILIPRTIFYQVTVCNQNLRIIPTFLLESRSSETP